MDTVYLKIDKNVRVEQTSFCLKDLGDVTCSNSSLETKLKLLPIPSTQVQGPGRYVYSVIDVIQTIQKEFPQVEVNNLGEADFIVTIEKQPKSIQLWPWIKTAGVCLLSFFGAAFSIMAFNNDIGITEMFGKLYQQFTGQQSSGFTVLEFSYSVGVGLGILIFFNHFAKRKITTDPTPLEVKMRTYEDDIDQTLIEADARQKN